MNNSIFESDWWLNIVTGREWQQINIDKKGDIVASFAFPVQKKFFGKTKIIMPQMTQTLGIWFKNVEKKSNKDLDFQKKLINEIMDKIPKTTQFDICLDPSNEYVLPFLWKGYAVKPRYTYRIDDLSDLDHIFMNFTTTKRNDIRRAQKELIISKTTDTDALIYMMKKTFERQNRKCPYNENIIREIVSECTKRNQGMMVSTKTASGELCAVAYFVYDSNVCYYLFSGFDDKYSNTGAQALNIWEGIQFASGVSKIFDFEGSMIEGIEGFVRGFGARPVIYYEISKKNIWGEIEDVLKPHIKKIIGYKM